MGADTQSFEGILKDFVEDFVAEQVNNKFPLKKMFRFQDKGFKGREISYSAKVSRNVSPMFVGEDGAFADAGQQGHVQLRIGQAKLMARTRITWEGSVDAAGGEASFKQGKKDEFNGLIDDIARKDEYAISGTGSGILAVLTDDPGTTTDVDVKSPGGITGTDFGNRFIDPGMFIGAVNPATGVLRAGISKVASCNEDGTDVTSAAAVDTAWASGDYVVQAANSSVTDVLDTSYEKAWWGLMALIDDGTYRENFFGVSRNLFAQYKSYVVASTGALSMDLLQRVSDVVDQKLGGAIDRIVSHHSIRRLWLQIHEADRRYNTGATMKNPDLGTGAFKQGDITIGDVTYSAVRTFPLATMMLLDVANSDFVQYVSEPGKFVDEDGSMLVRVGIGSTARDAFEAWYRMRKQNHVRYPGKNARLDGITGQTLVVTRGA